MSETMEGKRLAAVEAASMVRDGQVVGLGTGSTAALVIEELGRRVREEDLRIEAVATSYQSAFLACEHGIPLRPLETVSRIDLAIDGADEVDPEKNLIKGGGGCHLVEKIVDHHADRLIVVVDDSKLVSRLGERFPVPLEVVPMAVGVVRRAVEHLGGRCVLRMAKEKAGPVITDLGNLLLDVHFGEIHDPPALERTLNQIAGAVGNGLFTGVTDRVVIGQGGAVRFL